MALGGQPSGQVMPKTWMTTSFISAPGAGASPVVVFWAEPQDASVGTTNVSPATPSSKEKSPARKFRGLHISGLVADSDEVFFGIGLAVRSRFLCGVGSGVCWLGFSFRWDGKICRSRCKASALASDQLAAERLCFQLCALSSPRFGGQPGVLSFELDERLLFLIRACCQFALRQFTGVSNTHFVGRRVALHGRVPLRGLGSVRHVTVRMQAIGQADRDHKDYLQLTEMLTVSGFEDRFLAQVSTHEGRLTRGYNPRSLFDGDCRSRRGQSPVTMRRWRR